MRTLEDLGISPTPLSIDRLNDINDWKEQSERERDCRLGMLKEIDTTGRGIAIDSDAAERCIDDIQKELSKAEAGNSIGNVKAALQIIRKYRKAKEVR